MLGPLANCVFHILIGGYLRSSPNSQDRSCLGTFFGQLLAPAAVACKHRQMGGSYVVSTCNHVILIKPKLPRGFVISNIKPVGGSWFI
jgi:hypothetical protein